MRRPLMLFPPSMQHHQSLQSHLQRPCGWCSHAFSLQSYYNHANIPTDGQGNYGTSQCDQFKAKKASKRANPKTQGDPDTALSTVEEKKFKDAFHLFMRKTVPILVVQSGMSHSASSKFLVAYETYRPVMPFKAEKLVTRRTVTWNAHEKALAADLWKIIRAEVIKHCMFGMAIDAAVDKTLARFIMILS